MPQTFYIVRHGNTFGPGDIVTRVGGRTDLNLSASGQDQADALAQNFAATPFARCLASPLKRTWQTAETILAAQDTPPEIEPCDMLREMDYGPDENQPEEAVRARLGDAALAAWDNRAKLPDGWQLDIPALIRGWHALFAGSQPDGNTLIVTSNGIARFALLAVAGAAHDHRLKLKTGAYGIVRTDTSGSPHIAAWNLRP